MAAEMKTRLDERERTLEALADATPENLKRLEADLAARQAESSRLQAQSQALAVGVELALALSRTRDSPRRR